MLSTKAYKSIINPKNGHKPTLNLFDLKENEHRLFIQKLQLDLKDRKKHKNITHLSGNDYLLRLRLDGEDKCFFLQYRESSSSPLLPRIILTGEGVQMEVIYQRYLEAQNEIKLVIAHVNITYLVENQPHPNNLSYKVSLKMDTKKLINSKRYT